MDKIWYYTQGGGAEKKGPVTDEEMRALVTARQVRPDDLVWSDGMANWTPAGTVPELQTQPVVMDVQPMRTGSGEAIPPGMLGWMTLVAVMSILEGALYCLGCIWIPAGIFMIIAGVALLGAKTALTGVQAVNPELGVFFTKMASFMKMTGISFIVMLITMIIAMVLWFGAFAAALSKMGQRPM